MRNRLFVKLSQFKIKSNGFCCFYVGRTKNNLLEFSFFFFVNSTHASHFHNFFFIKVVI